MTTSQKLCVQCALGLALFLVNTPAHAAIMREDVASSEYEAYGQQSQFQSVGWMGILSADGLVYPGGSGVYLGNGWVLTEAHVVDYITSTSGFSEMQFGVGSNFYTNWGEYGTADSWSVYPGYSSTSGNGTSPDLALVHLTTSLSVTAATLYAGTVEAGDTVSMVGYGSPGTDYTGILTYDGIKRGGTNIVEGYGGQGAGYSWFSSDYMFTTFDGVLGTSLESMGSPGDSGGGVFITVDGETYLVGLMSFYTGQGTAGLLYGNSTGIIDLTQYSDWINDTMSAPVPEPSSIIIFGTGMLMGPLFLKRRRKQLA